ncbi:MAG: T9SS type A sorting domain-containing protein [Bacteroidales bacterium]|nr:T9SS type A sorting domain-containing protein [Candidatus Latescibacterota bacterium]
MSKVMKVLFPVILCSLLVAVPALQAFWCEDGVPVCTAPYSQFDPETAFAFAGHTLITWRDFRNSTDYDIYIQRIDEFGSPDWTVDGINLCAASGNQIYPQIINDGGGGAIVAWEDNRGIDSDIYAQRIKSSGVIQWTTDGEPLCVASGDQESLQIVADGAGGAIVIWEDNRGSNTELYAQRINSLGNTLWTSDGILVSVVPGYNYDLQVTSDESGGAIVTWRSSGIYAQRIDASGTLPWGTSGVEICSATGDEDEPQIVSDEAGGAIITWIDSRRGGENFSDIYAQYVSALGTTMWTADGILVSTEYFDKQAPQIISDEVGGAIITWHENRYDSTGINVFAQRVRNNGTLEWGMDAVDVSHVKETQGQPRIVSDGSGGAIIAWIDYRNGFEDIYAQKIDNGGILQWRAGGAPVALTTDNKYDHRITEDGSGGAFVAWTDNRYLQKPDLYAQWVDTGGMPGYRPTVIESVSDIAGDQGGYVRITIEKHSYDDEGWFRYPIFMYHIWRRVDDPAMLAAIARSTGESVQDHSLSELCLADWPVTEVAGRRFLAATELLPVQNFPPGTWEILGTISAFRQDEYLYVASTRDDSTSAGIPMQVFCVSAHPLDPGLWYVSAPDSGYSLDNLAPAIPLGLAGVSAEGPPGVDLEWDTNIESDFSHYVVYRGSFAEFNPSGSTEIGQTAAPEISDEYELWYESYYKICAVDRHGNTSLYAVLGPEDLTGEDPVDMPAASYLGQNYPNPFNPSTTLKFGLSSGSHVSVKIYDTSGRLVRVVVEEFRQAGRYHEHWDGLNSRGLPVASGVYYYRLTAKNIEQTRKMILLR